MEFICSCERIFIGCVKGWVSKAYPRIRQNKYEKSNS